MPSKLPLLSLMALSMVLSSLAACRGDSNPAADAGVDGGGETPANIEVCAQTLEAPSEGVCGTTAGSGSAVVIHGDVIGEDVIYEGGTVVYEGTAITCVGCDCTATPGYDTATVLSCPGAAVSPGLINPHDHITFTEGTPINIGSKRYDHRHQWRKELNTPQNAHGTGGDSDGTRWGEMRMLMSGVTSMVGSGKANNMVRNLDRLAAEDEDLGFEEVEFQTFSLGDSNSSSTNKPDCSWNYKDTELEVSGFPAYLPHVAEGIDEYAATEFRCQSSSFDNAQDFTENNVTHIHAIGLTSSDYFNMARDGARVLWSPRSNISLYGMTAQVQTFHQLGGTVALGTDWTYSGSANMTRELACADEYNRAQLNGYFSDQDLFDMATINAAVATASDQLIGSLAVGKIADIAIFGGDARYYRAIIGAANENVSLVIAQGDPLFGDEAIMSALNASCDPIDVCGTAKAICASSEFGTAYAGIRGAVTGAYPAFFCGAPNAEPTCIPSRPGEYTGQATDDDNDGDGIANATDNCPDVFNPIRPIDSGTQPDGDGDGAGDACDETPLAPDLDSDGTDNLLDNCPFDANSEQTDSDADMKGDSCDFCPGVANPDSICPQVILASTIAEVQNGTSPENSTVFIVDVVVTAVYDRGFWVQDPLNVGTQSGIHIYLNSEPGLSIGDQVDVQGRVTEFFGDTELTQVTVTPKGTATPIVAADITVAQANTEEYEGMLVRLTDVVTFTDPYDCAADDSGCLDADLWEANDAGTGKIIVYDRVYADADWAAQSSQTDITGVLTFRFERARIQPRSAADLVTP